MLLSKPSNNSGAWFHKCKPTMGFGFSTQHSSSIDFAQWTDKCTKILPKLLLLYINKHTTYKRMHTNQSDALTTWYSIFEKTCRRLPTYSLPRLNRPTDLTTCTYSHMHKQHLTKFSVNYFHCHEQGRNGLVSLKRFCVLARNSSPLQSINMLLKITWSLEYLPAFYNSKLPKSNQ